MISNERKVSRITRSLSKSLNTRISISETANGITGSLPMLPSEAIAYLAPLNWAPISNFLKAVFFGVSLRSTSPAKVPSWSVSNSNSSISTFKIFLKPVLIAPPLLCFVGRTIFMP